MQRSLASIVAVAVALCVAFVWVAAMPQKAPPALTDVQKLQIQNAVQRVQIAQLQMQNAQAAFVQAREAATTLLRGLNVPGYALDLQTLQYVKASANDKKDDEGKTTK